MRKDSQTKKKIDIRIERAYFSSSFLSSANNKIDLLGSKTIISQECYWIAASINAYLEFTSQLLAFRC